jgi:tetratricopeptide (TPR) repeat protein
MKIVHILGLALATTAVAQSPLPEDVRVVGTTLSQVRKSPDAYRGVWIRLTVQYASLGKISNPFFTQFEPSKFANFYAWADEQAIWKKAQYEDLFGLFFVDKQTKIAAQVYNLKVFQRLEIVGVVRNVFQGKPWIEVTQMNPLQKRVNTATLSHVYRAETHMKKRQWKRAISELSLAPGKALPDHVRGEIHKNLAMCFLRLGESATAVEHLRSAVSLLKSADDAILNMMRVAKTTPESFLDRAVANSQVEDHQRPMWEAFEGQGESSVTTDAPSLTEPTPAPARRPDPSPGSKK